MTADVITIFPRLIEAGLEAGVIGRARERGVVDVRVRDLRDYTDDRHRTVDDVPYGGGPGMVMKPEPLWRAVEAIAGERGQASAGVLMKPQGRPLTHAVAERRSRLGPGLGTKPEPLWRAVEAIAGERGQASGVVLMTPQGRPFSQAVAERMSRLERVVVICGRYEGVDERVTEGLVTDEISIGDYVLTG